MMKRLLAVCFLLVSPVAALADQAERLTKAQADKAVALLKTQKEVRHYCPPCADKGIYPETIERVFAFPSGRKGAWHVFIREEGDALDLAYVYFKDKTGRWKNVAMHLGMKIEDVPLFLPEKGGNR